MVSPSAPGRRAWSNGRSARWTGPSLSLALALAAIAGLLAVLVLAAGEAQALKGPTAKSLRSLVKQTKALPGQALKGPKERKLKRKARHAKKVAGKKPCRAVKDLNRYRRILDKSKLKAKKRRRNADRVAALGPASLDASRLLLESPRTKRCGGGIKPTDRDATEMKLLESDVNGMRLRVKLPDLQFVPEFERRQAWTRLALPNTDAPADPGKPAIPIASSTFGVPDGAKLSVETGATESYRLKGVDVFPAQPEPVDDVPPPDFFAPPFSQPPFELNRKAYDNSGLVPREPADGRLLGTSRDLVIGALRVPAARYKASAATLEVVTSMVVNVEFQGGANGFNELLGAPWEHAARKLSASLLNANVIDGRVIDPGWDCGEEMLVITNPLTRPAADQFATARRAAGLRTSVFETGNATGQAGTTAAGIQAFIRSRLTALGCIHPSYVTIMGDDDLVPTFTDTPGSIPSDLGYSLRNDADELPDVAVGRIIGNDQSALATAVSKIVGYETTAPGGSFLRRATIAAQFQDDDLDGRENRTFILFAETVRTGLVGRGVIVDRIYEDSPTTTPEELNDGTPLPAALQKPNFAWDGDGADVTNAWNDGRFLMIHRDHGWSDGWGHPLFTTTNVDALTNGAELPVVMSINCSSGAYDNDETSFAGQSLVNPNGGSVGVFGDTRDSPSWHNTQIALGFVDGLLPSVLPTEGPASKQRTGDALITGKLRLAGLAPPGTDGNTRNELYLWHYFGDPSMQMWGGEGPVIDWNRAQFDAVFTRAIGPPRPDPPPYRVNVTLPAELQGETISLLREGQVIGKAIIGNGVASIPADFGDGDVKPGDLRIALESDGAQPFSEAVRGIPKADTRLTMDCPEEARTDEPLTVSGQLEPRFAGARIVVTYVPPQDDGSAGGTPFERTVTTNADGSWSSTVDPATAENQSGTWTVRARFEGNSAHEPSSAEDCTFEMTTP